MRISRNIIILFTFTTLATGLVGCVEKDDGKITPTSTPVPTQVISVVDNINTQTNMEITTLKEGTGAGAKVGDSITVRYVGTFIDGKEFDSGDYKFVLGAGTVIQGWDEGLVGIKVGEKRKLVIPPELAYGMSDYGPIPGKSTLIFETELLAIE